MTKELAKIIADGVYVQTNTDKPIYRLVFRRLATIAHFKENTGTPNLKVKDDNSIVYDTPLINYVHASSKAEAIDFGLEMSKSIDYVFCYDETELIEVKDIKL